MALSLAGASDAGAATRAGPIVGVGEQKPTMFQSRPWKALDLRLARYTAPWDALEDPQQLALLDAWMASARRARVRVLLGFAHSLRTQQLARVVPTPRRFEREFKRFRARYPWVRDWLVWNEANHPGSPTARRPRRAAQLFDAVARNCRGCQVVAADVLDTSNMAGWVERFRRFARHTPRIWGLHNYGDANGLKTKSTLKLLSMTRGKIWFTETGGVVVRRIYRGRRVLRTYRYSLRHAARSTAHALELSCLSRADRPRLPLSLAAAREGDQLGLGARRPSRPSPARLQSAPTVAVAQRHRHPPRWPPRALPRALTQQFPGRPQSA